MEREIYVDILVFLNTVINFFLLLITACIAGREKKTGRILAAAFFGGVYALILLLPQLGGPVLTLTRAAMAAAMTAIAFPFRSLRTFLFQWGLLYLAGAGAGVGRTGYLRIGLAVHPAQAITVGRRRAGKGPIGDWRRAGRPLGCSRYREPAVRPL